MSTLTSHSQIICTYVGDGLIGCSGFGGPAVFAKINDPIGCTFDREGNYYFANQGCSRVCKVDISGATSIVAVNGSVRYYGDGASANPAELYHPIQANT